MDCIENCEVIDKFHDDELALRKELTTITEERNALRAELDLYKEAYTMACSRVKLYSQKHDRDWEAYHLRAARNVVKGE